VSATEDAGWRPGDGWATGVGSMPGTDPGEAAAVVAGELPDLPHLPELPARGPGADLLGRLGGLLVDLHLDLQPSGWRLVDRPGLDERRARSYLSHDLDEMQSAFEGVTGPVKLQVCGPWTAAAAMRLPRGEPVLSDTGAVQDLAASLAEGMRDHVAEVRRRLPGADPVLQVDEPSLPAVLAGAIRSTSGTRSLDPVPEATVEQALRAITQSVDAPVAVHCCAARPPVALLRRSGAAGLSLDLTVLSADLDEQVGEALDGGATLLAGLVPAVAAPARTPLSDVAATVAPVRRLWRRIGLDPVWLRTVVVTPTCGLAGADPGHTLAALQLARAAARQLADDPEG